MFDHENSDAFRTRLAHATTLRDAHKQLVGYYALIDRMDFTNEIDGVMTPVWLETVKRKCGATWPGGLFPDSLPDATDAFMCELKQDFARATKVRLVFPKSQDCLPMPY